MMDALGSVQQVLVQGGTSDIARATVRALAGQRRTVEVTLAARAGGRRTAAAAALVAQGLQVSEVDFEATEPTSYSRAVDTAFSDDGDIDVVIVAFGVLAAQEQALSDLDTALRMANVNYGAAIGCGVLVAQRMRQQGHGAIVALSSVAGERPRPSNFVYGSTKAGMDAFYTGLGAALRADGVHVLVVRPGFVRSKMTAGLRAAPLSQSPEQVARVVVEGLRAGRHTVWAPPKLRWVMGILRHLPRAVFTRLPV